MMGSTITRLGETIQIWGTSSGTDSLGNPVSTWDVNKGTFIGAVQRPAPNDVLFAPAPSDASIATGDRLEIDSVVYDLYGTLADWQMKLGGTVQYLQLFLKRVV